MAFLDLLCVSGLTFSNVSQRWTHARGSNHTDVDGWWTATYVASAFVWAVDVYLQLSLLIGYASNHLIKRYLLVPRHWINVLNLVFAGSTLCAAGTSVVVPSTPLFRLALGYLAFFKWVWFLDQIRLIEAVGLRVLPITTTMFSAVPFTCVLLLYLLGAANMYFAIDIDSRDFMECFIQMYHLTVLGEVDMDRLGNPDGAVLNWALKWLTVVMSFVIGLVLTNLFIAVLCHSYTVAAECARQDLVWSRAASVLEQFAIREGIMTTFCPRRARTVRHRRDSAMRRVFTERNFSPANEISVNNAYVWVARVSSDED